MATRTEITFGSTGGSNSLSFPLQTLWTVKTEIQKSLGRLPLLNKGSQSLDHCHALHSACKCFQPSLLDTNSNLRGNTRKPDLQDVGFQLFPQKKLSLTPSWELSERHGGRETFRLELRTLCLSTIWHSGFVHPAMEVLVPLIFCVPVAAMLPKSGKHQCP